MDGGAGDGNGDDGTGGGDNNPPRTDEYGSRVRTGVPDSSAAARQYQQLMNNEVRTVILASFSYGEHHSEYLRVLAESADAWEAASWYPEAERLRIQVLEARRKALGPNHPNTIEDMLALVRTLVALDPHEEAEQLRQQALQLRDDLPEARNAANFRGDKEAAPVR